MEAHTHASRLLIADDKKEQRVPVPVNIFLWLASRAKQF
jgi:hypothetical protein